MYCGILYAFFAGDLEIVKNATRRHTRDVGTIFPSPGAFKNVHSPNTFGSAVPIPTASTAKPTQSLTGLKRNTSNKSVRTPYQNGAYCMFTDKGIFHQLICFLLLSYCFIYPNLLKVCHGLSQLMS